MSLYGAEPLFPPENVLFTVEPHTTNLLCNKVLNITNDFLSRVDPRLVYKVTANQCAPMAAASFDHRNPIIKCPFF